MFKREHQLFQNENKQKKYGDELTRLMTKGEHGLEESNGFYKESQNVFCTYINKSSVYKKKEQHVKRFSQIQKK